MSYVAGCRAVIGGIFVLGIVSATVFSAEQTGVPSPPTDAEAEQLLADEPMTIKTWPIWRERLLGWIGDRSDATDMLFDKARQFVEKQASGDGQLPDALAHDSFAWYMLGSAQLREMDRENVAAAAARAEKSLRHSIALDDKFARAHRNLALTLLLQAPRPQDPQRKEAQQHLDRARQLDPSLSLSGIEGQAALMHQQFAEAASKLREAVREEPKEQGLALALAQALVSDAGARRDQPAAVKAAGEISKLVEQFPKDAHLRCLYAVALAQSGEFRDAARQFKAVRALGADPSEVIDEKAVDEIESLAAPGVLEIATYVGLGFLAVYVVIMGLMVLAALVLARFTRGTKATSLLGGGEIVRVGGVVRTSGESWLARLYGLALMGGLIVFYLSIPFVVIGLIGATLGILYAIFMLPRSPVKLVVIVFVAGIGMAWAVLKSLFAKPGSGSFGIKMSRDEERRLCEVVDEVAARVNTKPVNDLYLAPGSEIGVHQEGRGPFGVFGVKQRVLTLGLASLQHLRVDELKSILAHEYAHFSHGDTFYSRFIHQVTLAIGQSLRGMGQAGGNLNYINPFFWFLCLYYMAYNMMAAGFSRSREFLADRMAASLYGSDVFKTALTTVATRGTVFEISARATVSHLLDSDSMLENLYESFRRHDMDNPEASNREEVYRKLLQAKGSLFASHPTIAERLEAIADLPFAAERDDAPARDLLHDPPATEKDLTKFFTAYVDCVRSLQTAARIQSQM